MATPLSKSAQRDLGDLGFGSVVASRSHFRMLNRDGSYNVRIAHGRVIDRIFTFHALVMMPWPRFLALLGAGYLLVNVLFALVFLACGPGALTGNLGVSTFQRAFFFSVNTFATIGYGNVSPATLAANMVVTAEAMVGLLGFAIATGLVFARFSRPVPDMRFSESALIAPYNDITAFEFRVVNGRRSQLVNVQALVTLSRFETIEGQRARKFYQLELERDSVAFFPLSWTVVHPITEQSPLSGWTKESLAAAEAEFFILLTAVDETYAQTVHSRASYTPQELEVGRKFALMFSAQSDKYLLDLEKLNAMQ